MRRTIDDALAAPGPVTLLKGEVHETIAEAIDVLNAAQEDIETVSERAIRTSMNDHYDIRLWDNPQTPPGLHLDLPAGPYDPSEILPIAIRLACDAANRHAELADRAEIDDASIGQALADDFLNAHPDIRLGDDQLEVRLNSPFQSAQLWTRNGPGIRANTDWSREFIAFSMRRSTISEIPVVRLLPVVLTLPHPTETVDPVTRLWAAGRIDLFKTDPGSNS